MEEKKTLNYTFEERLKELRADKGVGQIELAKAIGVSNGIISLWENGLREPKLSNLIALSKYFQVSLDFIAGLID
ncbi:MAG: helix-turn-helix transcriptional regulator [Clostridia bacterium]|nr:helix-turn-helix transcriptional regulator [Clostridia bacterium]